MNTTATQVVCPPTRTCIRARGCGTCHAHWWSAAVHGSSGQGAITLTITAGENCRTQSQSIKSRTSPGKFISLPGNLFPQELTTLISDTDINSNNWQQRK